MHSPVIPIFLPLIMYDRKVGMAGKRSSNICLIEIVAIAQLFTCHPEERGISIEITDKILHLYIFDVQLSLMCTGSG
jgi:hypothetical protein